MIFRAYRALLHAAGHFHSLRDKPMTKTHLFPIDAVVTFQPVGQAEQMFKVVRLMPAERGTPQYRLRSCTTGQERVAEEAHLKSAPASA